MSSRKKILLGVAGFYIVSMFFVILIFGATRRDNEEFAPQNEFKTDTWISLPGPFDFNKAVLYLLIAGILTVVTMLYIANRMQQHPNRVQTAVETTYQFAKSTIVGTNMDRRMATRWFTFVATLFIFIWFSNMLGYFPLPTNTEHKVNVFGLHLPTFALYAATANLSVPLTMTLVVWFSYHWEGVRAKGFVGYLKSWIPDGVTGFARIPIFAIEVISHFVRIISLSVRLFANILAGHLLILFMGGGLVVLLGIAALGIFTLPLAIAFYLFEVVLIATLQAFIFATLTAIYLGGATAEHH